MAISQVFYAVPLNIVFALNDKNTNVSKFQIATNTGKIIFIIISGLLLSHFPNSFLFLSIASSIFYILSIVPIIKFNKNQPITISKVKTSYSNNKHFRLYHVFFSLFQTTIETLIPLYLHINNLSFETIASVIALVEVLKIVANIIAKKLLSKKKFITSCIISFSIFTISLVALLLFKHPVVLYIFSSLISISFPLSFVPLFYLFCKQSQDPNETLENMSLRDIDIFSARTIYYGLYFAGGFLAPLILGIASGVSMLYCQIKIIESNKNT